MDPVFDAFCRAAWNEAQVMAAESDILSVSPLPPLPPSRFLLRFDVPYLRRRSDRTIEQAPGPVFAAVLFPADYVRGGDPMLSMRIAHVVTSDLVHPNVFQGAVCLGAQFNPGTPFRVLARALYDLLTFQLMTLNEPDAMDRDACRAIRSNPDLLPRRPAPPLTRRTYRVVTKEVDAR